MGRLQEFNWFRVARCGVGAPVKEHGYRCPGGYSINQAKHKAGLILLSLASFSWSCVLSMWLKGISAK